MAVTRYDTVNNIINRAAVEIGLTPVTDVFQASDPAFTTLRYQLDNLGQDLIYMYPWQRLKKDVSITTDDSVTTPPQNVGKYALPDDFAYFVNQTGWDTTNDLPLYGPLSDQNLTRLEGRDLAGSTVYVGFKIENNYLEFYPGPPTDALVLTFKYITRNWVDLAGAGTSFADKVNAKTDVVLYDQMMAIHFLAWRFLASKGFPSAHKQADFEKAFGALTGIDTGAKILNLGRRGRYPYLGQHNIPDTGYGS